MCCRHACTAAPPRNPFPPALPACSEVPAFGPEANALLDRIATSFSVEDAQEVRPVARELQPVARERVLDLFCSRGKTACAAG